MKKLLVFGLALFLVVAFTLPASALENVFGGYWRTRFYKYTDINGKDDGAKDYDAIDTRTRLYYTAIINDKVKLVNKLEMNAIWGSGIVSTSTTAVESYGDIAADGAAIVVKNTYVNAKFGDIDLNIGTQGFEWGRNGFLFSDDGTGVNLSWRGSKNFIPAFYWIRSYEGQDTNPSTLANKGADEDYYTLLFNIKAGDFQIVPYVTYVYSNNAWANSAGLGATAGQAQKVYYAGLDLNMKLGVLDVMLTGIYQGGDRDDTYTYKAYLLDALLKASFGNFGVRGQALYGSGDSDTTDNDLKAFTPPTGASYTWSEGYASGDIDKKAFSGNVTGSKAISNLMAFNLGADFAAGKDLKFMLDFWNIRLAQDDAAGNKDIGNEIDFHVMYKLLDPLTLDLYANYMIAGDAFYAGDNDANPYELAAQLSISF